MSLYTCKKLRLTKWQAKRDGIPSSTLVPNDIDRYNLLPGVVHGTWLEGTSFETNQKTTAK
jgi:hypothetical protein